MCMSLPSTGCRPTDPRKDAMHEVAPEVVPDAVPDAVPVVPEAVPVPEVPEHNTVVPDALADTVQEHIFILT